MKGLALILFIFLFCFQSVKAQWKQLHDSSLLGNAVNSTAVIGDYIFAATSSGIYYSRTDRIEWKRRSVFYSNMTSIISVDSSLYLLPDNGAYADVIILHSRDLGLSWDTIRPNLNVYAYAMKLFHVRNQFFLKDPYRTWYSYNLTDWTEVANNFFNPDYVVFTNEVIILKNGYNPPKYLLSVDGVNYDSFITLNDTNSSVSGSCITYSNDALYVIFKNSIMSYVPATHAWKTIGKPPGYYLNRKSHYFDYASFFTYANGVFYIAYNRYDDLKDKQYIVLYKSTDQCSSWQLVYTLPVQRGDNYYSSWAGIYETGFITYDGKYAVDTKRDSIYPVSRSIDLPVTLQQYNSNALSLVLPNQQYALCVKNGDSYSFIPFQDTGIYQQILYSQKPMDMDDTSATHHVLTNGRLLSEDDGTHWDSLRYPFALYYYLLGYTDKIIMLVGRDTLAYTTDRGKTWSLSKFIDYKAHPSGSLVAFGHNTAYMLSLDTIQHGMWQYYHMMKSTDQLQTFSNCSDTIGGWDESLQDFFINESGVPELIREIHNNGSYTFHFFVPDTITGSWQLVRTVSYPEEDGNSVFLRMYGRVYFFDWINGLNISTDREKTIRQENTFPRHLKVNFPGSRIFPRLGKTIYIGTSAGIWYYDEPAPHEDSSAIQVIKPQDTIYRFDVYPNPTKNGFSIRLYDDSQQQADISIIDMAGRDCGHITSALSKGNNTLGISTTNLRNGMYILQLKTKEQVYTAKVVIE